jgi:hypothetical protein
VDYGYGLTGEDKEEISRKQKTGVRSQLAVVIPEFGHIKIFPEIRAIFYSGIFLTLPRPGNTV